MCVIWKVSLLVLLFISLVSCQPAESPSLNTQPPPRRNTPISNLFSGLEGLVLGVDETIHRLSSPESFRNVEQTGGSSKSDELNARRKNYYDLVRENYEQLQRQIRQTIEAPGEVFKVPELVNMNFQNKGQKSFINLATPFVNLQIRGKATPGKIVTDNANADGTLNLPTIEMPYTDMSTNLKVGGSSLFPQTSEISTNAADELQKRSGRPSRPMRTSNEHHISDTTQNKHYTRLDQPILPYSSDNKGRILGDLLFSESTFDKYIRRALESPVGKLVLDPSISPPAHVVEKIRTVTRNPFGNLNNAKNQRPAESTGFKPSMNKNTFNQELQQFPDEIRLNQRPRIMLAFTLDGIPLKFKIDQHMRDPLEFLHRRLASAGVSLNIPVDSVRGTVPVGNNILQLGSGFTSAHGNALYVDLTNESQLQSLLRSLKSIQI